MCPWMPHDHPRTLYHHVLQDRRSILPNFTQTYLLKSYDFLCISNYAHAQMTNHIVCEMNALKRRATVTMIHILIHSDKPPPIQLSFEKYSMQFRHQIWQVSCRGWNHSHIQWSTSLCSSDYVMSCLCSLSLIHLESSASYCIHMSHLRSFL